MFVLFCLSPRVFFLFVVLFYCQAQSSSQELCHVLAIGKSVRGKDSERGIHVRLTNQERRS